MVPALFTVGQPGDDANDDTLVYHVCEVLGLIYGTTKQNQVA